MEVFGLGKPRTQSSTRSFQATKAEDSRLGGQYLVIFSTVSFDRFRLRH